MDLVLHVTFQFSISKFNLDPSVSFDTTHRSQERSNIPKELEKMNSETKTIVNKATKVDNGKLVL